MQEKIEIMSTRIPEQEPELADSLRTTASSLGIGLGWHYILDLTWAARELRKLKPATVVDAGAGSGVMQWWLARQGVDVVSVDRTSRAQLPARFRQWTRIEGMRPEDLAPSAPASTSRRIPSRLAKLIRHPRAIPPLVRERLRKRQALQPQSIGKTGKVTIYNTDLADLRHIASDSVDAVVSISALEHNDPSNLPKVTAELLRVLRPGGALVATLGAARERDWFHEASKGWCYTEETLREKFDLKEAASNYAEYDQLFEDLRNSTLLRESLASMYYLSGNNGMPWGRWDPQYQSVGIVKIKR